MNSTLLEKVRQFLKEKRKREVWRRSISAISVLVMLTTIYVLIYPAIATTTSTGVELQNKLLSTVDVTTNSSIGSDETNSNQEQDKNKITEIQPQQGGETPQSGIDPKTGEPLPGGGGSNSGFRSPGDATSELPGFRLPLNQYISSVFLNENPITSDIIVELDQNLTFRINFDMDLGQITQTKHIFYYQLPEKIKIVQEDSGEIQNSVIPGGESLGTYRIYNDSQLQTGVVELTFNNYAVELNVQNKITNGYFYFTSKVEDLEFDESGSSEIVFLETITNTIKTKFKMESDLGLTKVRTHTNQDLGITNWKIVITSNQGTKTSVLFEDIMDNTVYNGALSVVKRSESSGGTSSVVEEDITSTLTLPSVGSERFILELPRLMPKESYTIQYESKLFGSMSYTGGRVYNNASVRSQGYSSSQVLFKTARAYDDFNRGLISKYYNLVENGTKIEWGISISIPKNDRYGWLIKDIKQNASGGEEAISPVGNIYLIDRDNGDRSYPITFPYQIGSNGELAQKFDKPNKSNREFTIVYKEMKPSQFVTNTAIIEKIGVEKQRHSAQYLGISQEHIGKKFISFKKLPGYPGHQYVEFEWELEIGNGPNDQPFEIVDKIWSADSGYLIPQGLWDQERDASVYENHYFEDYQIQEFIDLVDSLGRGWTVEPIYYSQDPNKCIGFKLKGAAGTIPSSSYKLKYRTLAYVGDGSSAMEFGNGIKTNPKAAPDLKKAYYSPRFSKVDSSFPAEDRRSVTEHRYNDDTDHWTKTVRYYYPDAPNYEENDRLLRWDIVVDFNKEEFNDKDYIYLIEQLPKNLRFYRVDFEMVNRNSYLPTQTNSLYFNSEGSEVYDHFYGRPTTEGRQKIRNWGSPDWADYKIISDPSDSSDYPSKMEIGFSKDLFLSQTQNPSYYYRIVVFAAIKDTDVNAPNSVWQQEGQVYKAYYKNKAEVHLGDQDFNYEDLIFDEAEQTQVVIQDPLGDALKKTSGLTADGTQQTVINNIIPYTLTVNEGGIDLPGNKVELRDEFSYETSGSQIIQSMLEGTPIVKNKDTSQILSKIPYDSNRAPASDQYMISHSESREILQNGKIRIVKHLNFILPDKTPIEVDYKYRILASGTQIGCELDVKNEATIKGLEINPNQSISNIKIKLQASGAGAGYDPSNRLIVLSKISSYDHSIRIPNAKFYIERYIEGRGWEFIGANGSQRPTLHNTNIDGQILLQGADIRFDTLYRVTEIEEPKGYKRVQDSMYFVVAAQDDLSAMSQKFSGVATWVVNNHTEIFICNDPGRDAYKLKLIKLWQKKSSNPTELPTYENKNSGEVKINVYQTRYADEKNRYPINHPQDGNATGEDGESSRRLFKEVTLNPSMGWQTGLYLPLYGPPMYYSDYGLNYPGTNEKLGGWFVTHYTYDIAEISITEGYKDKPEVIYDTDGLFQPGSEGGKGGKGGGSKGGNKGGQVPQESTLKVYIINKPVDFMPELPATGASGSRRYLWGGLSLMFSSIAFYISNKKEEEAV